MAERQYEGTFYGANVWSDEDADPRAEIVLHPAAARYMARLSEENLRLSSEVEHLRLELFLAQNPPPKPRRWWNFLKGVNHDVA